MEAPAEPRAQTASVAWHAVAAEEVVERLDTDQAKGLDASEAARRLVQYGPNRLPEGKKQSAVMRFLLQFNNILVYVLLGAGFVKLMVGLWLDAAIILGVVAINGLLGFLQEGRAEKALDSIRNMLSAEARSVRGGEVRLIPAEELVPGDVVLLESGDKIPADLRLLEVKKLRTEEAPLTGESVPIDKTIKAVSEKSTVGDREGMAFSGTLVASGRGRGIVVATGADTELGRINQMMAGVATLDTPLLRQIKQFGYAITAVIGVVSVLMFAYGRWVRGMAFVDIFQAVVSIAVSIIPEGLPALITVTLAIGVQRMAQRNAIIRRLPAVETLGSVSRICSDKTGTLTLMEMMVVSVVTADAAYTASGDGYAPEGKILCFATTLRSARRTACGRWKAIRRRARSTRAQASSAWNASLSRMRIRASMRSPSNPSTSSWPRCTARPAAGSSSWSRARRRRSSSTATGKRPAPDTPASTATISPPPRTSWPPGASACWPWRGSKIRASGQAISDRRICRGT
jgi:magnesium-transporting ATPase (P-type)